MIKDFINIANELDRRGLVKEADYLEAIIIKISNIGGPDEPADESNEFEPIADYCVGMSVNADLQWKKGTNVDFLKTKNVQVMKDMLKGFAGDEKIGNMKIVDDKVQEYGDQDPEYGFTYYVTLGQSHMAIHTWPEMFLMNIDIFTCGDEGDPVAIFDRVVGELKPDRVRKNEFGRSKGLDWATISDNDADEDAEAYEEDLTNYYEESEQKTAILKDIMEIFSNLNSRGLSKEADHLGHLIKKQAKATGRISALKIMLQRILRRHGFAVGRQADAENEGKYINVPLNVNSNKWGNLDHAWSTFAKNILRMPGVGSDWVNVAGGIGVGYGDGIGGMYDLLEDFEKGGRAAVGADVSRLGALAPQEDVESAHATMEEYDEYLPGWMSADRGRRVEEFASERARLEAEARRADAARAVAETDTSGDKAGAVGSGQTSSEAATGSRSSAGDLGIWNKQANGCWIINRTRLTLGTQRGRKVARPEGLKRCRNNMLSKRNPNQRDDRWHSARDDEFEEHIPSYSDLEKGNQ